MGDLSGVFAGLSVAPGVAAIFGAGAVLAAVGFASWLTDKIASFFESHSDDEEWTNNADDVVDGQFYECPHCSYQMDSDDAIYSLSNGYCVKCGEDI